MAMMKSEVFISQADFNELNSDNSRWTMEQYAYWAAKFKTGFPAEGYGIYNPHTRKENNCYYICWSHADSCD